MLRWVDGIEQYGVAARMIEGVGGGAAWSQIDSGFAVSTSNPATGTYHLRLTATVSGGTNVARRILGVAKQVSAFACRFSVDELPAEESYDIQESQLCLVNFADVANSNHCRACLGTDGSIYFVRADTLVGRSDPCVAPGGYHHIETKCKIDNATGYAEVRVNEVTVLNLTGIDTQSTANASTAQFILGEFGDVTDPGAQFSFCDFDDFFAWDDDASDVENTVVDFVGDKGCYYLKPNGDTAEADWTKSTGVLSYAVIDEVGPSGGTDYLSDATGSARTIVQVEALPGNVSEVIAFMPVIYARKEDSGSVTMRGGIVVGTDETYGPDDSPSTGYAYLRPGPKTIDPDTGVAWASNANPDLLIERTA